MVGIKRKSKLVLTNGDGLIIGIAQTAALKNASIHYKKNHQ